MMTMKKMVALLMIVLLMPLGAMAETLDLSQTECTLDLDRTLDIQAEFQAPLSFDAGTMDTVSRDGDTFIVDAGYYTMALDMGGYPAYLCLTQDLFASFESYLYCTDPHGLQKQLVEEGISYFLRDMETGMIVYIYKKEGDSMSGLAGNLSALSDTNQAVVCKMFAPDASIAQAGGNTWIVARNDLIITIFNGQYLVVQCGGTDDPDADLEDTLDILTHLTLS